VPLAVTADICSLSTMNNYTIYLTKIEEQGLYLISAYMATCDCSSISAPEDALRTESLQWSITSKTVSPKLILAGTLERMIEVEFLNFYSDNIHTLCAIALQTGNWKATERMQSEIDDFIRFTLSKLVQG
jgi:hypothetical protein